MKLDELVRAIRNARTSFVDIEELPDEQLDVLEAEFRAMHVRAQEERETRGRRRESSVRAGS
ncbi:MAG TPA: low affinity iron permease family protein [Coriobacteriia bacterium]|nr:low affinity iron permease family protein [Coriobacteriia bacterium]